jgi:hypothetical protein
VKDWLGRIEELTAEHRAERAADLGRRRTKRRLELRKDGYSDQAVRRVRMVRPARARAPEADRACSRVWREGSTDQLSGVRSHARTGCRLSRPTAVPRLPPTHVGPDTRGVRTGARRGFGRCEKTRATPHISAGRALWRKVPHADRPPRCGGHNPRAHHASARGVEAFSQTSQPVPKGSTT